MLPNFAASQGSICFFSVKLIKEILCQVENRRSAAFTGGKRVVGKSLSSCDGILNVPPPVMAASQCFFLTCFLMLPPHLQSLVIICLSSHFLPGKNQFLLSGRNFIRNSFLAALLLLQPAMPPDRYPTILFSNSFCLHPRPVSCIICSRIRRTTMIVITSAKSSPQEEG